MPIIRLQPGHYSSLTAPNLQPTAYQERNDQCGNQHYSRELLMMAIVMPETCWAYKKHNKIISGIYLVFYSSVTSTFFEAGLLLTIRMYYSVHTATGMCHAFMLTGCWQDPILPTASKHKRMTYTNCCILQSSTSWWWAASLLRNM